MNALTHAFDPAVELDPSLAVALAPLLGEGATAPAADPLAARWQALHDAAQAVAGFAQLGDEAPDPWCARLPSRATACEEWQREMVSHGIDDLSAVMQTGLRALLGVVERGDDATAAAIALWREYHAGRKAICALAEAGGVTA